MSFFVQSTSARQPKTPNVRTVSRALAIVLAVMAVTQIATLSGFIGAIGDFWLPFDLVGQRLLISLLIVGELAAIPFLLRLRLSPAMRIVSMVSGWLVLAVWLVLQVWINTTVNVVANNGILGGVALPVGWYMVFGVVALGALAAWSSWGLWPLRRKHKARKTPPIKKKESL